MARTYKRFGVLVARHEEQREPARARRSSHAMGAAALCSRHRTSPLTVLGKVAAAPIANYLLAVLPPEQEIDRAKKPLSPMRLTLKWKKPCLSKNSASGSAAVMKFPRAVPTKR